MNRTKRGCSRNTAIVLRHLLSESGPTEQVVLECGSKVRENSSTRARSCKWLQSAPMNTPTCINTDYFPAPLPTRHAMVGADGGFCPSAPGGLQRAARGGCGAVTVVLRTQETHHTQHTAGRRLERRRYSSSLPNRGYKRFARAQP